VFHKFLPLRSDDFTNICFSKLRKKYQRYKKFGYTSQKGVKIAIRNFYENLLKNLNKTLAVFHKFLRLGTDDFTNICFFKIAKKISEIPENWAHQSKGRK
ncbi:hypothetical protein NL493_28180, partial [Klebsiella pneumoniae]|nr:hypothetical protein [Klebsiella pneumoniae]